jgi:phosphopantothenoylcysteine decarboxylase/phosphopantothenate--cysteine ligase
MDEDNAFENAKNILDNKGVDAVCLNVLKDSNSFGSRDNAIELITKERTLSLPKNDKLSLSLELLEALGGK